MEPSATCILCFILSCFIAPASQGAACRPGCHPANGFCENPGECRCHAGWKGPFCNQCMPFPGCVHGSCTKPWQCVCEEGWIGSLCDIDIHPCAEKPCSLNSTCIETGDGGYICLCAPGFTGKNCVLKKGPCITEGSPCQNGGTCIDNNGFASHPTCHCPLGFVGNYCEIDTDYCNPNPCENGGHCTNTGASFQCHCPLGFTGLSCSDPVPLCGSNPCKNGGTCYDNPEGQQCVCLPEFTGPTCYHPSKNQSRHAYTPRYILPSHPKSPQHQGREVLKITVKKTIHNVDSLLNKSQVICFIVLGLLTCLIVLITTGIVFFSKCETWFANAKYSHLLRKNKNIYMQSSHEEDNKVKIIYPEKVKIANYSRNYTTI
ncbi:protein delta homolog 1 [Rhinophrynus dorsalis]